MHVGAAAGEPHAEMAPVFAHHRAGSGMGTGRHRNGPLRHQRIANRPQPREALRRAGFDQHKHGTARGPQVAGGTGHAGKRQFGQAHRRRSRDRPRRLREWFRSNPATCGPPKAAAAHPAPAPRPDRGKSAGVVEKGGRARCRARLRQPPMMPFRGLSPRRAGLRAEARAPRLDFFQNPGHRREGGRQPCHEIGGEIDLRRASALAVCGRQAARAFTPAAARLTGQPCLDGALKGTRQCHDGEPKFICVRCGRRSNSLIVLIVSRSFTKEPRCSFPSSRPRACSSGRLRHGRSLPCCSGSSWRGTRAVSSGWKTRRRIPPPIVGVTRFFSKPFLWFYLYFGAAVGLFAAAWRVIAPHPWFNWSVLGSALIIFVLYFMVEVSVTINDWYGTYFDLIQKALDPQHQGHGPGRRSLQGPCRHHRRACSPTSRSRC